MKVFRVNAHCIELSALFNPMVCVFVPKGLHTQYVPNVLAFAKLVQGRDGARRRKAICLHGEQSESSFDTQMFMRSSI